MKRPFPRIERPALIGLAAALATFGVACSPNQSVKPGAPVLTEIDIVENPGTGTQAVTNIPGDVADCPTTTASGDMCDPTVPADAGPGRGVICRQGSANNWCRCAPNPAPAGPPPPSACTDAGAADAGTAIADASTDAASADGAAKSDAAAPLGGTWNCEPFSPTSAALFTFDRLLDTVPLDPGDGGPVTTAAMATFAPPPPDPVAVSADYASNGTPNEIIFPLLGDIRVNGPSLLIAGQPALPTSAAVTITLDPTKVRAKDGKTAFTGTGFFAGGTLTYTTAAFSGTLTAPPTTPPAADAGACTPPPITVTPSMTPATATFNNLVDATALHDHITITVVPAATVEFVTTSADGLNVSITPKEDWPASSSITITLDSTATDLAGDPVGPVGPAQFTTSAN
jgi:hypothetical protein